MARVVIVIEDQPDGTVRTVATPSLETMMKKNAIGERLTSAEGYAIAAINRIIEASKEQGPHGILIPKLYRGGPR